ncbi:MAG: glycosyltransferase family 4 protein [Candidatus Anammoximicrobium sp.]|nr:glycosyltransferase family 4 protein [Candidatus Anammoximicrobium sp.]
MRILIVSPFPRPAARGNSVAAARLARGFDARGHDTVVVDVGGCSAAESGPLAEALAAAGGADVALILHAAHGAEAARMLRDRGTPYLVSVRGTDANEMLADPRRGPAVRAALAGARRIAVFHSAMHQQLAEHVPGLDGRVRVVPNGISLPVSRVDYRARLGLPPDALVFVSLAGLREIKRPLFPIEHLGPLATEFPQLRFVRAGPALETPLADALGTLVARLSWVHDAGEIPHDTVDSFLRSGDVFVSASRSEGMPHAVREAMLTARALLLADIPGHRAMAEPEREALFFHDPATFQAAARRLVAAADLRRRLGNAARARAETELAAHDEIGEYLTLLSECRSH